MSVEKHTTRIARETYFHPTDPAGWLKPGEPFIVDGLDWAWAFVWYLDVPDFPGYCVGSNGTVWSRIVQKMIGNGGIRTTLGSTWRKLRPQCSQRHLHVVLCKQGKIRQVWVHRLVLEVFIGPCPDRLECCHWDDDAKNNRLANLRWDTNAANKADSKRNGTARVPRGENHPFARLTADQVRAIRTDYAAGGVTQKQLAIRHGVCSPYICMIIKRKSWAHIP